MCILQLLSSLTFDTRIKVKWVWEDCRVPKYHAAVNYTPRLRAPRNLPRCMANSDTCEAVANNYPGSATANSYLGTDKYLRRCTVQCRHS